MQLITFAIQVLAFFAAYYVFQLYKQKLQTRVTRQEHIAVAKSFKSLQAPKRFREEETCEISVLYVHPIRGIKAEPVKHAFVGPNGIKYDREMVLVDTEKNAVLTTTSFLGAGNLT